MCIFVASTEHPDYSFVLLDNRDEFLDRGTAPAHWWPASNIYAPQDLERRGTWIGANKSGRVAVLVNFHDENKPPCGLISRGNLPRMYLESDMPPAEWVKDAQSRHAAELAETGGFTLLVAQYSCDSHKMDIHFLSNRDFRKPDLAEQPTIAVSNGAVDDDTWVKTRDAERLFRPLLSITSEPQLIDNSLALLSTDTEGAIRGQQDLRKHIFIPQVTYAGAAYGTRSQTVITIDKKGNVCYTEADPISNERHTEHFKISYN